MGRYLGPQKNLGIRKGCWTPEEDALLTHCVEKYGEGQWKHVPLRAGLNRCRKSCRLRWLNYLRPNIKRSEFAPDEVDLMIKLHKLLGNRWSLIAGRIPGRTANDIKNYWNSHLSKKLANEFERKKGSCSKVIKPRPFTFQANSRWLRQTSNACGDLHQQQHQQKQCQQPQSQVLESSLSSQPSELSIGGVTCPDGEERTLLVDNSKGMGSGIDPLGSIGEIEWDDFFIDMDLWNSLGTFEVNQNI